MCFGKFAEARMSWSWSDARPLSPSVPARNDGNLERALDLGAQSVQAGVAELLAEAGAQAERDLSFWLH